MSRLLPRGWVETLALVGCTYWLGITDDAELTGAWWGTPLRVVVGVAGIMFGWCAAGYVYNSVGDWRRKRRYKNELRIHPWQD